MDDQPGDALVRVRQVHKYFRRGNERIDVLNGLNLDVPEGEFLGLMGPSGSGKTTLLNLIAGLDVPSEGEIWVGRTSSRPCPRGSWPNWRTQHVGFIFQFYHLLPVLNVFENVELPLLLLPLSARRRREQVRTVLDLVGLSDRVRHRPGQLSGGQQQRVGIARAIVTDPTLIVADEPTGRSRRPFRRRDPRSAGGTAGNLGEDHPAGHARPARGRPPIGSCISTRVSSWITRMSIGRTVADYSSA